MKTCNKCGVKKDLSQFHKQKTCKDGLKSHCRSCSTLRNTTWAKNNPEKAKAADERYKKNNLEKIKSNRRIRDLQNSEKIKEQRRQWRLNNPGREAAIAREVYKLNPSRDVAKMNRRRAARVNATPVWADHVQIQMFYDLAAALNAMGEQKWHVDHIVPLQSTLVCGLHCEANLCVVTATENISKSNRYWPDMPS